MSAEVTREFDAGAARYQGRVAWMLHRAIFGSIERFLGILERVRQAMPEAAITTDIIVGFPGETEEDFQATLDVVEQARFSSAFTFQYSPRPGTPAATMDDQVPPEDVSERYKRLIALQEKICLDENQRLVRTAAELLVFADEGPKSAATQRKTGRARDGRLVHFTAGYRAQAIRPGDVVTTTITGAAPHHLVADAGVISHRTTRAGDAHEKAITPVTAPIGVGLGMPSMGPRPAEPAVTGCSVGCGS